VGLLNQLPAGQLARTSNKKWAAACNTFKMPKVLPKVWQNLHKFKYLYHDIIRKDILAHLTWGSSIDLTKCKASNQKKNPMH
jgi:hypothetical protein